MFYRIFRGTITTVFLGVIIGLIVEFIVVWLRPSGVFEHPFGWLALVMNSFLDIPGIWYFLALSGGLTAGMWLDTLARRRSVRGFKAEPIVRVWLEPVQAKEKFVESELLASHKIAQDKLCAITENAEHLDVETKERERVDAQFLARRRLEAVVESLRNKLRSEELVAKGLKVKGSKRQDFESYIPANFWGIIINGKDIIDFETGTVTGYLGTYQSVLIGKNESFQK